MCVYQMFVYEMSEHTCNFVQDRGTRTGVSRGVRGGWKCDYSRRRWRKGRRGE